MFFVQYGTLKEGKIIDFAKFWRNKENVDRLKSALTDGMKFLGVYFTILNFEDYDFEVWYEIDNWEVLDRDRENQKMKELNQELFKKYGYAFESVRTKVLRSVEDVKFMLD